MKEENQSRFLHKAVYCSADYFIDISLPLVNELSKICDVDIVISYGGELKEPDKRMPFLRFLRQGVGADYLHRLVRRRNPVNFICDTRMFLHIVKKNPRVVFFETVEGPYFVLYYILLRLFGFRIIQALHDVVPHSGTGHWADEFVKRTYMRLAHTIVVYSRDQAAKLQQFYGKRSSVARLPYKDYYERPYAEDPVARENNTILFFGVIRPNKGLDILMQAAEIARNEIPDLKVIVAGECQNFERYAELMKTKLMYELHIQRIKDEDVGRFFLRAQFLVLPYHDATQSGPPVIAYGFGCPVIATAVDSLPEYVIAGKTGLLCEENDPHDLAEKIISLLKNKQLLRSMQEYVPQYVRGSCSAAGSARVIYDAFVNH